MRDQAIPVLLDTDIGTDIDDALCLAYLLCHPRCELVGITTVTGEPEKRAMLADAICLAAGRGEIPIRVGAAKPLLVPQAQTVADQAEILPAWPHETYPSNNEAFLFLRQCIRARPGEITLLTIGPLTNIGLLFALDPDLPRLLRGLVMMAGAFASSQPGGMPLEWNARGDPHATALVYQAIRDTNLSVGLEVTSRCRLAAAEARERLQGRVLEPVMAMAEAWLRNRPSIVFHDPLAAASIFEPSLLTVAEGRVEVELDDPERQGLTRWTPAAGGPHRVAVGVDVEGFFGHYFGVVDQGA